MRHGALTLAIALAIAGVNCTTLPPGYVTAPSANGPAAAAGRHVANILDVIAKEAVNSTKVTPEYRAEVLARAADARSVPGTYPAIAAALSWLDDWESFYRGIDGTLIGPSPEPSCGDGRSELPDLPRTIGYVRLDGCSCDGPAADGYAESVQRQIREADRPDLAGWIVDLRQDRGGNMWPMIAGLGPIFGERIIGWIIYNNRDYEREYRDGAALSLNEPFARVGTPYTLLQPDPKVAVLTAATTNSAGEAIAVFFKNRPNTRSFGGPTCGHHHLLTPFGLGNGAMLTLKTAHNADRLKRPYAGPVVPDEVALGPGEAVARAVAWLLEGRRS